MNADDRLIEQLRAEAAYRSARLALYRARVLTARATSTSKLRELERAAAGAVQRLQRAERDRSEAPPDSSEPH
jgi:hypothetical protein